MEEEERDDDEDDEDNEDNGRIGNVMVEWVRRGQEGEEGDDEDDEDNGRRSVKGEGVRRGEWDVVGRGGEEGEVGRRRVGSGKIKCAIQPFYEPFITSPAPIFSIGSDISHLTSSACCDGEGVRRGEVCEVRRGGEEEEEVGRMRVGSGKIECAIKPYYAPFGTGSALIFSINSNSSSA